MIKQTITKILDSEMERKDFLKLIGLGVVAATGVTQIVRSLASSQSRPATASKSLVDYGAMTYGGK